MLSSKRPFLRAGALWHWLPMIILIATQLAVGLVIVPDFGISWDDPGDAAYGADALSAYRDRSIDWESYSKRKYYGPAHFMLQNLASPILTRIMPAWEDHDARRFVNLASFQIAIVALFYFARQLVRYPAALAGTLLFASQPLFLGHAFINGKDIPFMALFLMSLALGYAASRKLKEVRPAETENGDASSSRAARVIRRDVEAMSQPRRVALAAALTLFAVLLVELYLVNAFIRPQVLELVQAAYEGTATQPVVDLFQLVAEDRNVAPLEAYLDRGSDLVDRAGLAILAILAVPLIVMTVTAFPRTMASLRSGLKNDLREMRSDPLQGWTARSHTALLITTGIVAGLAVSIRVVGLLAIFLIGVLYLGRHRARAVPPLMVLTLLAAAITYLTWPYLWRDPLGRFIESYQFLVSDPNRDYVLFMGQATKGRLLPWFYLPSLMLFQLTEPVWLLVVATLGLLVVRKRVRGLTPLLAIVLILWITIPTVPLILKNAWFYDNFRQFLFVTPAFFMMGMFSLDHALNWLGRREAIAAAAVLLLIPGVLAFIRLHPYQYVYYNSLVGGVRGAERDFELDYWATSYSEAMRQLNPLLPQGSVAAFWGTTGTAESFARSDLELRVFNTEQELKEISPDVAVMITRANIDLGILPSVPPFEEVTVNGVVLAVVKRVSESPDG